jgi:hypothetical protein
MLNYDLYDIVFCDGDLVHAGVGFDTTDQNYRLHAYGDRVVKTEAQRIAMREKNVSYFVDDVDKGSKIKSK